MLHTYHIDVFIPHRHIHTTCFIFIYSYHICHTYHINIFIPHASYISYWHIYTTCFILIILTYSYHMRHTYHIDIWYVWRMHNHYNMNHTDHSGTFIWNLPYHPWSMILALPIWVLECRYRAILWHKCYIYGNICHLQPSSAHERNFCGWN